jgi:hypothetical protein
LYPAPGSGSSVADAELVAPGTAASGNASIATVRATRENKIGYTADVR